MEKILVAYASMHGSTQEIAEVIAAELREKGLAADVHPLRAVQSLEGYHAVVLGAPLYMFRWHRHAHRFLLRHQKALKGGLPVAVFAGGPFGDSTEKDWLEVRSHLDKALAKHPWLTPISVEIVGGRIDPKKLRFPYNLTPGLKMMPASDLRDWEAIKAWAGSLVDILCKK